MQYIPLAQIAQAGLRFLPAPHGSRHNMMILPPFDNNYSFMHRNIMSPVISPVHNFNIGMSSTGVPGVNMPGISAISAISPILSMPGTFVSMTPTPAATGAAATGTATGATTTAASGSGPGTGTVPGTTQSYNLSILTPPITNIRQISHPDNDPELRKKVVKYFYDKLKDISFNSKFQKLLKYIIVENDKARLVKSYEELQQNEKNNSNMTARVNFIIDHIFSKYDLELLISKLIQKYGMLFSDDEYNMHWYNAKNKYSSKVKKAMYKKIKYRLQKKVIF
jgi:hypothetical protein